MCFLQVCHFAADTWDENLQASVTVELFESAWRLWGTRIRKFFSAVLSYRSFQSKTNHVDGVQYETALTAVVKTLLRGQWMCSKSDDFLCVQEFCTRLQKHHDPPWHSWSHHQFVISEVDSSRNICTKDMISATFATLREKRGNVNGGLSLPQE